VRQVVRYTALLSGVFYGIAHRRTLQKEADAAKLEHAAHDREYLIQQAKKAWADKQASAKASDGSESTVVCPRILFSRVLLPSSYSHSSSVHPSLPCYAPFLGMVFECVLTCLPRSPVITDPENPKFDIEKLVAKWEKDLA
jgi:hypothetical protein